MCQFDDQLFPGLEILETHGFLLCPSDILPFKEVCFGESPEGKSMLVLNPGLCLLITRFVFDTNMILLCCVMNPLLCHGEVLHCDPFIHKFQCSKHQDKHPWFCFGVLVDLMFR